MRATTERPPAVVAAVVVVLCHAVLLAVGTVVSGFGLAGFLLTHPGASRLEVLLPTALGSLVALALAALEVVLAPGLWRGARRARTLQTVLSGLGFVGSASSLVVLLSRSTAPSAPPVLGVVLSGAVLVLLWLPSSGEWFRRGHG